MTQHVKMLCGVCAAPCRGQCNFCQRPLCASHKPKRGRCRLCSGRKKSVPQYIPSGAQLVAPGTPIPPYPTLSQPSPPSSLPDFTAMSDQQIKDWMQVIHDWLSKKQRRERGYLDRRAKRGTHTPTDEAYEDDQIQEAALLAFLDRLLKQIP